MSLHACPRCKRTFKSQNTIALHMLGEESCYITGEDITENIRHKIDTLFGQVEYLLHWQRGTSGDDEFLTNWHEVVFQGTKYYDPSSKAFHEKVGAPLRKLKFKVKAGSLSRIRRFVQREDKKMYHRLNEETGEWETIIPHDCVLPSRQTMLKHEVEAEKSRVEWGRRSHSSER